MNEQPEIQSEIYSTPPRRIVRRDGDNDWPGGFNSNPWRWLNQSIGGIIISFILCILGFGLTKIASVSLVGLALLFFGVPTFLIYFLLVYGHILEMKRHYRLVEWGYPATAVVVDLQKNPKGGKWLKYQFKDKTGSSVDVCLDNPSIAMRYKDVGTRFFVLYLLANPENSLPCEDLFFKAGSAQNEAASRSTQNNKRVVRPREILNGMVEPLLCLGVGVAQVGFLLVMVLILIFIPKILHLLVR